jgi:cytochrome oxidase Cu insertion factor (SCO1/SenC/PrrC family)
MHQGSLADRLQKENRARLEGPFARSVLWGLLLLVLAGAFFSWALTWQTGSAKVEAGPLPVIAPVPDFSLTERSGEMISRADLLGKVWIAGFVFTRCSGPCPQLSARMQRLQLRFQDEPDMRLVTFTLDPEVDTPAVLHDYANRFHADRARWLFLTTDNERKMHDLVRSGFFQTVIPATDGKELIHSEYLVLIDRQGRIRNAYRGTDFENQPQLVADTLKLLGEPNS